MALVQGPDGHLVDPKTGKQVEPKHKKAKQQGTVTIVSPNDDTNLFDRSGPLGKHGSDRLAPFVNPPLSKFASNTYFSASGSRSLYRGYMLEMPGGIAGNRLGTSVGNVPMEKRYRLYFHFNPQTISLAWQLAPDDSTYYPGLQTEEQRSAGALTVHGLTIGFQLIFDRVGDLSRTFKNYNGVKEVIGGVNADLRILEKIITQGWGGPGRRNYGIIAAVHVNFSRARSVYEHIDPNHWLPPSRGPVRQYITNPFGVKGYITDCNVTYTRFSTDMVPTRAVADISVQVDIWRPRNNENYRYTHGLGVPKTRSK